MAGRSRVADAMGPPHSAGRRCQPLRLKLLTGLKSTNGSGVPEEHTAVLPHEGGPGVLWTGGFFLILKGLSIIRIVQPGAGVHQQRGRGGRGGVGGPPDA
jgi:hypothetical protein